MYLVAGLGNPGARYEKTRHNVGFMLVDRIARKTGQSFNEVAGHSLVCRVNLADQEVFLAKPQTFMNASGYALQELVPAFGLGFDRVLIAYDDVALPLGVIRIRPSGSGGGHKGMMSVIEVLGSREVPRLRIGVLGETRGDDLPEYVLSRFHSSELEKLEEVLDNAVAAISTLLSEGIERAMTLYNSKRPVKKTEAGEKKDS